MHFDIVHEFDMPLDAVELAVLSPDLSDRLAARIAHKGVGIESITQKEHAMRDGVLSRVWSYQVTVKLPAFAEKYVDRESWAWDERAVYRMAEHSCTWTIVPNVKPEWQKFFSATGSYKLEPMGPGKCRRIITGEIDLIVPFVRQVAERMMVNEVKKTLDAEAETLRDLATLT